MPSVSSSSETYSHYRKAVEELENELKVQAKRHDEKLKARVEHMEQNHESALRKAEQQAERSIGEAKENASDSLRRERENHRSDMDRLRSQTYDKYGRYNGLEADAARRQLDDLKAATEVQIDDNRRAMRLSDDHHADRVEEIHKDHAAELEQAVTRAREAATESVEDITSRTREADRVHRQEVDRSIAELQRSHMNELTFERDRARKAIDDSQKDFDHRLQRQDESKATDITDIQRANLAQSEREARDLRISHSAETKALRDQVKELSTLQGTVADARGDAIAKVVDDYEKEWMDREKVFSDSYQRQIDALRGKAEETDSYFAHLQNDNLRAKDLYFSRLISQQNQKNHDAQKSLQKTFDKELEQLQLRSKQDRVLASAREDNLARSANTQKEEALKSQAKAYQETIERNHENANTKISALERGLQHKSTSDDVSVISPAAEAAVRKGVIEEYHRKLDTEQERNKLSTESVQREYATRLQDSVLDREARESQVRQQLTFENHRDRSTLLQHIDDVETMKKSSLRNMEETHARQSEHMNRNYSSLLNRQRKQYEEILQASKNDADSRQQAMRQELEFAAKKAQREFNARQSETARAYEKKLVDQKSELMDVIQETKAEADRALRDMERKNKLAQDEQARSHEQKLTQLEQQHQERERYLQQNQQEEIEKLKRSHALLLQKKS